MASAIRLASTADVEQLQTLELAAGQLFRQFDMAEVAAHPPPSQAVFRRYIELGQSWVLTDTAANSLAGFVLVDVVDGCAHIEQLSVHPAFSGRRLGAQLIEQVLQWARVQQLQALTLATFLEVPWNAPYYQRCGFRVLESTQLTPGLVEIRAHEGQLGLDAWPRVCMRRELSKANALLGGVFDGN